MIAEAVLNAAPAWAIAQAPVLVIAAPLLMATLAALLPSGRVAWIVSIAAATASLLCAIILLGLVQMSGSGVLSYAVGNWPAPLGIELRIDALSAMMLLVVTGLGVLAAVFSWPSVETEIRSEKRALFYAVFLLCLTGLIGVVATGDVFNLFVFLEISSLSAYVLVALGAGRNRRALPAAFNYLVLGTLGASFFVIGVGFLYAATGTLNMADIAGRLPALAYSRAVQAGFAFIIVGLGLKAAIWPLHQWLPNAYAYAPSFVSTFLAATATKVALYALIRLLFTVFQPVSGAGEANLTPLLAPLGLTAIVICSVQAIFQTDVRRVLAYASVAQTGLIVLGLSTGTLAGLTAGLFHLVNHALINGLLFMAVTGLGLAARANSIREFSGLGRTAPWTVTAFAIGALSLIGVPLTAGFMSKVQLGFALFEAGWWGAVLVVVLASFIAVIYMGRILQAAFFLPPENPRQTRKEAPLLVLVPLWLLALANVYFGVYAGTPLGLARDAALAVFGPGGMP